MINFVSAESTPAAKIMPMKSAQAASQTAPSLIDEKKLLDTARRLAELYLSGKSVRECAKETAAEAGAVRYMLECSGIKRRTVAEGVALRHAGVRDQVVRDYLAGESNFSILARKYGVHPSTVSGWLAGLGVRASLSKDQDYEARLERAVYDYQHTSKTTYEIMREHHVSGDSLYKRLHWDGIPLRSATNPQNCPTPAPASPTLPELHDQTGEALSAMQKMFSELTNRLSEMEKLLGAEKK